MLSNLIFDKNYSSRAMASARPTLAWVQFAQNGPEFVPSTQTCFEGGIGFNPRVSERSAGSIVTREQYEALEVYDDRVNHCWEMPCNVVLRSCMQNGKCVRAKSFFLTR